MWVHRQPKVGNITVMSGSCRSACMLASCVPTPACAVLPCVSRLHEQHLSCLIIVQVAAAEAAARADAAELEGWKRDSPAVLAALEPAMTDQITEVCADPPHAMTPTG